MTLKIATAELQTAPGGLSDVFVSGRSPFVQIKIGVTTGPHRTAVRGAAQWLAWENPHLIRRLILSKETEAQRGQPVSSDFITATSGASPESLLQYCSGGPQAPAIFQKVS